MKTAQTTCGSNGRSFLFFCGSLGRQSHLDITPIVCVIDTRDDDALSISYQGAMLFAPGLREQVDTGSVIVE